MKALLVTILALVVVVPTFFSLTVRGQNISQCFDGCLDQTASAASCNLNAQCVCTNMKFQKAALDCLQKNCTTDQNANVFILHACGEPMASASSFPGSSTTTGSSLTPSSPLFASTTSSSSSSSAMEAMVMPISFASSIASIPPLSSAATVSHNTTLVVTETQTRTTTRTATRTVIVPPSGSTSSTTRTSSASSSPHSAIQFAPSESPSRPHSRSYSNPHPVASTTSIHSFYWESTSTSATASPIPSHSTSSTRALVGIAVGVAVVTAVLLAFALFLHIRRRRRRALSARAYPFLTPRGPGLRGYDSRKAASSSSSDTIPSDTEEYKRLIEPADQGQFQTHTDGSVIVEVSSESVASPERSLPSPDGGAPRCPGQATVDGTVKLLQEPFPASRGAGNEGGRPGWDYAGSEVGASPTDAWRYSRWEQPDSGGGVRLVGGWMGEPELSPCSSLSVDGFSDQDVDQCTISGSSGSTLPPRYSWYFGRV